MRTCLSPPDGNMLRDELLREPSVAQVLSHIVPENIDHIGKFFAVIACCLQMLS